MKSFRKIVNKKALFDYHVIQKFEFGIVLQGAEIKSISDGKVSLNGSYLAYSKDGNVYIHGMHISAYNKDSKLAEDCSRIILLHKKERNKIIGYEKEPGKTIVPLSLYFNNRGFVKLECAIVEGKKIYDKRAQIKEREWQRKKTEIMK